MMQWLKRDGIQGRMLMAMVLFLIYVFTLWGFLFVSSQRNVQQQVTTSVRGLVQERCSAVENFIDGQFNMLQAVADYIAWDSVDGWLDEASMKELLQLMVKNGGSFMRLMAADRNGTAVYSDGSTGNVADRDYFQECMEGNQVISDPLTSRVDGTESMILAVPVLGDNGETIALLGGSLSIETINEMLYTKAAEENAGYTLLVDESGQVLTLSGNIGQSSLEFDVNILEEMADSKILDNSIEEIRADMEAGQSGAFRVQDVKNEQWYYGAYSTVESIQTRYLIYLVKEEAASKPYAYIQNVQVALLSGMVPAAFALLVYCLWVMAGQNRRLVLKAQQDSLTGLLNHASMRRGISALLKKEAGIHVLMILDLDHFKQINDTYGHQAGDRVLELVAGRLRGIFRSTDLIGRIGGDEFMIFMRSIGEEEMGLERAKRLCQAVHEIKLEAWPDLKVGCSIGVALAPADGDTYDKLYHLADVALYEAKRAGRHRVVAYRDMKEYQEKETGAVN